MDWAVVSSSVCHAPPLLGMRAHVSGGRRLSCEELELIAGCWASPKTCNAPWLMHLAGAAAAWIDLSAASIFFRPPPLFDPATRNKHPPFESQHTRKTQNVPAAVSDAAVLDAAVFDAAAAELPPPKSEEEEEEPSVS